MDKDVRQAIGCLQIVGLILFLTAAGFLGGAYRTEVTFRSQDAPQVSGDASFEEDLPVRFWLGGLIQGRQADVQQALAKHMRPGRRITEISITTKHTSTNLVVCGVTLGIYCPKTVTLRGWLGRSLEANPSSSAGRAVEIPLFADKSVSQP
jgi:hypothetical protein